MEVLLSFNREDVHLAEALRATLFLVEPDLDAMQVILSPACYGAVYFEQNIASGVHEANRFLLVIGPSGIGKWQEIECKFAVARMRNDSDFDIVPVLAADAQQPTTESLSDLNWIRMPVVTDRRAARWLIAALNRRA